jgi:hypothetical protein
MNNYNKYLKYKNKYLKIKNSGCKTEGGCKCGGECKCDINKNLIKESVIVNEDASNRI